MVFQQASGVIDQSSMDETAVMTFNQKFTQYEGDNVRGAQVNALVNSIIQNNLSNSDDASKQVIIDATGASWNGTAYTGTTAQTAKSGSALTGKSYDVSFETDPKSGYITKAVIRNAT